MGIPKRNFDYNKVSLNCIGIIMRKFLFLSVILTCLGTMGFAVNASQVQSTQPQNPKMKRVVEIIESVTSFEGNLTKEIHAEFWKLVKELQLEKDPNLKELNEVAIQFNLETWQSIKLSSQNGKVTKTKDYDKYKDLVLQKYNDNRVRDSISMDEKLMDAVSKKQPLQTPHGDVMLTNETIDQTLASIESAYKRRKLLLQEQWKQ